MRLKGDEDNAENNNDNLQRCNKYIGTAAATGVWDTRNLLQAPRDSRLATCDATR